MQIFRTVQVTSARWVLQLAAVAIAAALPGLARAEATLTYTIDGKVSHVYLCDDAVFFEADDHQIMGYDAARKVMVTVDHRKKTYMEISEADFEALGSQIDDAMAMAQEQMAEAMKNMTPEQQKAMKEAMKSMPAMQNPAASVEAAVEVKTKAMGKSQKINAFDCDGYTVLENGEAKGEMWVTSLDGAKLTKKDLEPISSLAEFVAKGMKNALGRDTATNMLGMLDPSAEAFVGLPVRWVDKEDGETAELTSVDKGKVDRKPLLPGADYTKQDMMGDMKQTR